MDRFDFGVQIVIKFFEFLSPFCGFNVCAGHVLRVLFLIGSFGRLIGFLAHLSIG